MQNHPHSHVLHAVHKLITDKIRPPVGVSVGPECNRAPGLQGTHPFDFLGSIYSIVDENQQRRPAATFSSVTEEGTTVAEVEVS